jgi:SAM-dependent methyltransferase
MALYNIKVEKGKRVIVWNLGRLRGIEKAKDRIGNVVKTARDLLRVKQRIRVLEVGCGYGRALLDLRREFGNKVETSGINSEKRWNLDIIRKFALAHKLFSKKELERNLPRLYIMDAGKRMKFPSNYFDLIFSQSTGQYIKDKARFLEEVNRLLTPKGVARIDLQHRKDDYPVEYKHLFEIWDGDRQIDFVKYIKRFRNIQVKKAPDRPEGYILMTKAPRLDFGLSLNQTIDLNKIHSKWWGTKAVYALRG